MGRGSAERRYVSVQCRFWVDEKIASVSKPQPNAQTLALRYLSGPETSLIPGVIPIGRAAMAEALEWEIEDFNRCHAELEKIGFAMADWKARLVYLSKAFQQECNRPASPSTAACWKREIANLPECDLARRIDADLRRLMASMGAAYLASYDSGKRLDGDKAVAQPAEQTTAQPAAQPADSQQGRQAASISVSVSGSVTGTSTSTISEEGRETPAATIHVLDASESTDPPPLNGNGSPNGNGNGQTYTIAELVQAINEGAPKCFALDPIPPAYLGDLNAIARRFYLDDFRNMGTAVLDDWRVKKGDVLTVPELIKNAETWIAQARVLSSKVPTDNHLPSDIRDPVLRRRIRELVPYHRDEVMNVESKLQLLIKFQDREAGAAEKLLKDIEQYRARHQSELRTLRHSESLQGWTFEELRACVPDTFTDDELREIVDDPAWQTARLIKQRQAMVPGSPPPEFYDLKEKLRGAK